MTKANGPKARPEVARKNAGKTADIYDFVQSPEWQKVLEKARLEQEIKRSTDTSKGKTPQTAKPDQGKAAQSTIGEQAKAAQKPWSESLEQARQQRNAEFIRRRGESVNPGQNTESAGGATGKAPENASAPPQNSAAEPDQSAAPSPQPKEDAATADGLNQQESEQQDTEYSLRLSPEEVDHRISKKLAQRLEDHQRARRKVKLGLIALGCVIGAAVSSSVILMMTGGRSSDAPELAGSGATGSELAEPVPLQDGLQTETLQSDLFAGTGDQVVSADLFDTGPTNPPDIEDALAESDDLDSLAALAPPLSGLAGGTEATLPTNPASAAPSVLSYVPALEQPLMPVGGPGYLPRREANPSFLPYEYTPEFFVSALAPTFENSTDFEPITVSVVPTVPRQRAPNVLAELALPQSPARLSNAALALLQVGVRSPDLPVSVAPVTGELIAAASDPSVLLDDVALSPPAFQPRALTLRPNPLEQEEKPSEPAALSIEIVEPLDNAPVGTSAAFRLYAPNQLSEDAVAAVVADLKNTGHELSGTARVGYRVSQSNVRFYHQQDAAQAAALAEAAGALLRDFTGSNSKTPSGVVELYLAGEGAGPAPVKRTASSPSRSAPTNASVTRLRSQVLKKLRTTAN